MPTHMKGRERDRGWIRKVQEEWTRLTFSERYSKRACRTREDMERTIEDMERKKRGQ